MMKLFIKGAKQVENGLTNIRLPNQFALGANVKTKTYFVHLSQSAKKSLVLNMLFNENLEICNQRMATNIIQLNTNHSTIQ